MGERNADTHPKPLDRRRVVYRWDLDKTYLRTEFDTIRDLLRTAFEPAARKQTVPGAAALLRELRATEPAGIFILSGSPEQMRRVLEAKLRLDGVRWDSFTLKPSLRHLLRGRFRFVRDQLGYKLAALLSSRAALPVHADEILFGDDAEADAFIYSIFADICAGRVQERVLAAVLELARVHRSEIPMLVEQARAIERRDSCRRIFIHLDRMSAPAAFSDFGHRVCPFYNYFQPALVLLEDGAIDAAAALRVGAELVSEHAFNPDALMASYMDLVRRKVIGGGAAHRIIEALSKSQELMPAEPRAVLNAFGAELETVAPNFPPPLSAAHTEVDYLAVFARDLDRARSAKRRALLRD